MRIDAHHHFWLYDPTVQVWMGPRHGPIRRSFLPSDLLPHLASARIDGSIVVQAAQMLAETDFLLAEAASCSKIVGVVGWVDLCSPELPSQLARYSGARKLVGVRHVVHDEPDDLFMAREDFRRGIAALAQAGLCYDLLLFPRHLRLACQLAASHPEVTFVLDHAGNPDLRREGLAEEERARGLVAWEADLRALATLPNVNVKLSGLVTRADWGAFIQADLEEAIRVALDAFGPTRCMVGSDWPVCTLSAAYGSTMGAVEQYVARHLSAKDAGEVMGGTAARVYKLQGV